MRPVSHLIVEGMQSNTCTAVQSELRGEDPATLCPRPSPPSPDRGTDGQTPSNGSQYPSFHSVTVRVPMQSADRFDSTLAEAAVLTLDRSTNAEEYVS